ncbi:M6 family metalloprotease domain-containing protein [Streptomyces antimicrobicus]|uniref:M6 family metalloprotease domain-containing protein n=1 Tax=Streptomyces antimicrobicus TaxID=2883108 RepID=A0ABS8B3Y0_9ACTN|nr:M6 family metalloprotease domain-containing protein [Streptomyces antimicrobicus]MCB5179289.1 M6 family metalloprotease domain-containing protein [Streptomyces antimicrobicus]
MSGIFGDTLTYTQEDGGEVRLVTFGDDKYARYETLDGWSVVYDATQGRYCYATDDGGGDERRFVSTGVPISQPPPAGLPRHLREGQLYRRERVKARLMDMVPPSERAALDPDTLLTFGPQQGLLPGDALTEGDVQGLTILVDFPGTPTDVPVDAVEALLNAPDFTANGNTCSVKGFFETMSTGRLRFTNTVVGPYRLSRPRLAYTLPANQGLLVPEALQAALDDGVDFGRFDSLGRGVVDSICIMYAGRTEFRGDLWPHNSRFLAEIDGVTTNFYTVTSIGESAADLSIGTFCHESGHLLCRWPDLYDYGKIEREGDDFTSAGLGTYCTMAAGNHLGRGFVPSAVCVYLRRLVGWTRDVDISEPGTYEARHGAYDEALVFPHPGRRDIEYYLVENRSSIGFDAELTSSGLAVYHCDIRGSNEFQQGTPTRHYQCALLQADGHMDLETNRNQGDGADLYGPTPGTAVSHGSRPASLWWDGTESGLTLSSISAPGEVITFRTGERGVAGTQVEGASTPGAAIVDDSLGGLTDAIVLEAEGTVQELTVTVDIEHPRVGDLRVVLLSPTGRRAVLHNRTGGDAKDLRLTLGSQPPTPLAPLLGDGVRGTWKLKVADVAAPAAGTLLGWSLTVRTGT